MKISIEKIEQVTGYKVKKDFVSIGFDWATRAGVSIIKTDKKEATIDYIFIEFTGNAPKEKYKMMVKTLEDLIDSEDLAIIEDVFVGFNRAGSMELAKYHAFAVAECIKKKVNYETITALSCRSRLGIKTTKKAGYGKGKAKLAVADWLKNNLNMELNDEDASDCYDKETEVLTEKGWKFFKDLNKNKDTILSMDLDTHYADYFPISKLIKQKYNGDMYYYNSATCNFLVTPNHKLIIKTTALPKHIIEKKKNCYKTNEKGQFTKDYRIYWHHNKWKWHFEIIKHIKNSYWWMPRTFKWIGQKETIYILPKLIRDYNTKHKIKNKWDRTLKKLYVWNKKSLDIRAWLAFLGWYISEGSLKYNKNKTKVNSINITQTKNKKYIKEIANILKKLKLKSTYLSNKIFQINNAQLAEHLSDICYIGNEHNCYNKKIPNFIKKLSPDLIDIFLESYCKGDGWIQFGERKYSTASRKLADDVQELILKTGKLASVIKIPATNEKRWYKDHFIQNKSDIYQISELKRKNVHINKKDLKIVKYTDFIYCLEVNPHHTILVRRNGKVFWSGNSVILAILGILKEVKF